MHVSYYWMLTCGCAFSVDFVLDQKGVPLLEAYDKWRNWADSKVCCDYALHVAVTHWSDSVAKEMEVLARERGQSWSPLYNQNIVAV